METPKITKNTKRSKAIKTPLEPQISEDLKQRANNELAQSSEQPQPSEQPVPKKSAWKYAVVLSIAAVSLSIAAVSSYVFAGPAAAAPAKHVPLPKRAQPKPEPPKKTRIF
jgi:hypothetical protein